jgi:putative hydrolase of the HAD superfamily
LSASTVIFDLDDTLIIEAEVARSSLRRAAGLLPGQDPERVEEVVLATARRLWRAGPFSPLCRDLGISSWEALWATFEGGHGVVDELGLWARSYRPEVWRTALAELGVDDEPLVGALSDSFIESQRRGHRLIEGAAGTVRALRRSRRLGLLTNGPADIQRLKLEGTGLADCFEVVVISGEVGVGKPDPTVFKLALDGLGAAPQSAVMVGDSWERDVLGALGAGLSAVWVSGGRLPPEERPEVTVIDTVGDLRVPTPRSGGPGT